MEAFDPVIVDAFAAAYGARQIGAIVHNGGESIATSRGSLTVDVQQAHDDAEMSGAIAVNMGDYSRVYSVPVRP